MTPDDPRHGTPQGTRLGCREACCENARYVYDKERRLHVQRTNEGFLVPAWRSLRRLHALQALGWSVPKIADWCDRDYRHLYFLEHQEHTNRSIFQEIDSAYRALSMKLPEASSAGGRISIAKTRAHAARKGYAPPLAWDNIDDPNERPRLGTNHARKEDLDHVVVERALAGEHMKLTRAERSEVVKRARGLGWSEEEIQRRTGIAKATDKTRFGDHLPDCGCKPGTASNGWIEKRSAKCSRDIEAVAA